MTPKARPLAKAASTRRSARKNPAEKALPAGAPERTHATGQAVSGPPSAREWLLLALILAVGLALRASYLHEIRTAPDFDCPLLDPELYDYWARALVSGDWVPPHGQPDPLIPSTAFTRPPGYPYFLALVYLATDASYLAARLAQMALGLVNCVLMFALARALFGRAVGLVATAFMAVYWVFIYFEGELNSPVLVMFLVLCAMNVLRLWLRKPTLLRALAPGVLLGLLVVTRPEALLFLPLVLVWAWWALRGQEERRRRFRVSVAGLVCGFAAMVAPVTIRNYAVGKEFVLISTGGGFNFYAGNNELSNGVWPQVDMMRTLGLGIEWSNYDMPTAVRALERRLGRQGVTHSEFSRYFTDLALEYILEHPGRIFRLVGKKALLFWGPAEVSNNKVIHYDKLNSPTLRLMPGFPAALAPCVLGLLLLAASWARQRKRRGRLERSGPSPQFHMVVLVLLYVGACFVAILPFHMAARYRVPIIPFLLLFAAYGVCRVAALIGVRDARKAVGWCMLGLALCGLLRVPLAPYEPSLAQWRHDRAQAFRHKGQHQRAIEESRKAVEADALSPAYRTHLAIELAGQGKSDEAVLCYKQALRLNPHFALAHNNLGHLLYTQGKTEEAIGHYEAAIEADFQMTTAYRNLGRALLDQARPEAAIVQFARILEVDPGDRYADYDWGRALAVQGKSREALEHYSRALQMHPDSPGIHNKIAVTLDDIGREADAVRHYRRALEIDPQFAPAHINLALALAGQGRFEQALEHYERGLAAGTDDREAPPTLGGMLEALGKAQVAAALYDAVPEAKQGKAQTHIGLAKELATQGKLEEAVEHYLETVRVDPRNADAYFNLGAVTAVMKQYGQAIGYYTKAVELSPDDTEAIVRLGKLLGRTGDMDGAVKRFRDALAIDPDNEAARACLERAMAQKASPDP